MRKVLYLSVGLLFTLAACKKDAVRQTPNGLSYTVIKEGNGDKPEKGEFLIFDFQLKDNKDSVWQESYKSGLPLYMPAGDTSDFKSMDGITQMLNLLSKGDSVKTTMSIKDFFTKLAHMRVPPGVDTTGTVTYTIKVHDIMPEKEFAQWRDEEVTKRDDRQINKYLADNHLQATKDTSGIYYIIHNQSEGPKPAADNCVEVSYAGKFLANDRLFDKNDKIAFSLNEVIHGWTLAIPMLAKGDSGTFFIPSKLAYGPQGCCPTAPGAIPRDAVLVFDVKLLNFSDNLDPATRLCK